MSTQEPDLIIEGEPAYNLKKSALYLDVTYSALQKILKMNPHINKYEQGYGKEKFLRVKDLDELKKPRIAQQ